MIHPQSQQRIFGVGIQSNKRNYSGPCYLFGGRVFLLGEMKMVCRAIMIVIACGLVMLDAVAQPERPDTLWTKRYGGPTTEECSAMCRTQDGGYLLAGLVFDPDVTTQFFRTDSLGNLIWSRRYSRDGFYTVAYDIAPTPDGGGLVAGRISSIDTPSLGSDIYLVRLNSEGDTLWTRIWGTTGNDQSHSIKCLNNGGFIAAGFTEPTTHSQDMYVLRLDSYGDTLWTRQYITAGADIFTTVEPMPDGGFVLAGGKNIIRIDEMGDTIWTKTIQELNIMILSICLSPDAAIIATGFADVGGPWFDNFFLARFTDWGDTAWTHIYEGEYDATAFCVTPAQGGGYVITGEGEPECEGMDYFTDIYFWRTDETGNLLWSGCYNLTENDESSDVIATSDGGYVIAGQTHTPGAAMDMLLIKTRPDPLDVPSDHIPTIPARLELSAYPNPFNSSTTIVFNISQAATVKLNIYNLIGDHVYSLVDEWLVPGTYRARFDGEALSSGVFFIRAESGLTATTQKIVLLR